jgi:hypothetical protein
MTISAIQMNMVDINGSYRYESGPDEGELIVGLPSSRMIFMYS